MADDNTLDDLLDLAVHYVGRNDADNAADYWTRYQILRADQARDANRDHIERTARKVGMAEMVAFAWAPMRASDRTFIGERYPHLANALDALAKALKEVPADGD